MSEAEKSIAEAVSEHTGEAFGVVDSTVEPTPENFNPIAWIEGVRPTRRSVRLHQHAHLVGVMEQIEGEYREAEATGASAAQKKEIVARYVAARDEFWAKSTWFTVEKRSSDWVSETRSQVAKAHGIKLGEDGDDSDLTEADKKTLLLAQLARQIVSPKVDADFLGRLYEANEGELAKLLTAMTLANSQQAESARVASRDFSLAPSEGPPRKRSGSGTR